MTTRIGVLGHRGSLGRRVLSLGQAAELPICPWEPSDDDAILAGLDVLIGCLGRIPEKSGQPRDLWDSNVQIPAEVSHRCLRNGVRFFHVSTDCVFGDRLWEKEGSWTERLLRPSAQPSPTSLYGISKAMGDALVMDTGGIVLRTSFIAPEQGLWRALIAASAAGEENQELTDFPGWINAEWSGSTVVAVAERLLEIATTNPEALGGAEALHIATQMPVTKYQVVEHLVRKTGLRVWPREAYGDSDLNHRSYHQPGPLQAFTRALYPSWTVPRVTDLDGDELRRCMEHAQ